jgi:magnesium chelatase subunit H
MVLFNFPPNAGNTGTAAYLSVFAVAVQHAEGDEARGLHVDVPETSTSCASASSTATPAASAPTPTSSPASPPTTTSAASPPGRDRGQWGPAPGKQQSDGSSLFVLGEQFGNVFVGVQPASATRATRCGCCSTSGFTPTHAFSAFYRFLREDFGANAVLHFGTHGALEFMPGKQAGHVRRAAGPTG